MSSNSTSSLSNMTIDFGRPMHSRGQGFPTPRSIRSFSFPQWVVAWPYLFPMKFFVQAFLNGIGFTFLWTSFSTSFFLLCSRYVAVFGKIVIAVNLAVLCKFIYSVSKEFLEGSASGYYYPDADGAFGMKSFEVF